MPRWGLSRTPFVIAIVKLGTIVRRLSVGGGIMKPMPNLTSYCVVSDCL